MNGKWVKCESTLLTVPQMQGLAQFHDHYTGPRPIVNVEYLAQRLRSGGTDHFVYCTGDASKDPIGALLALVK